MTWAAERLAGVWPEGNWRVTKGERSVVVYGGDEDVMHVVEALNAYERPALPPAAECADVDASPAGAEA